MAKALVITVIIILVIIVAAWYLISPAFQTIEIDDTSPLVIRDAMVDMDDATKAEFDAAVEESNQDEGTAMSDSMPSEAQLLAEGGFKPRAHEVDGKALLIQDGNNKILRFEDFETLNGPNLHIYLSSELGDSDFIDLGKIKATSGNVNYEIPDGVDTNKYNKVLVWCVPFRVLFSYAELQ